MLKRRCSLWAWQKSTKNWINYSNSEKGERNFSLFFFLFLNGTEDKKMHFASGTRTVLPPAQGRWRAWRVLCHTPCSFTPMLWAWAAQGCVLAAQPSHGFSWPWSLCTSTGLLSICSPLLLTHLILAPSQRTTQRPHFLVCCSCINIS